MENRKSSLLYLRVVNFSETYTVTYKTKDLTDFEEVADMYVINTCSVTENADKQFKQVAKSNEIE
jgi:threonylcarbamoyladenosine tRNA methylthiotransferase MtaB